MKRLIDAIDRLLDFVGDRVFLAREETERFHELDREVFSESHLAELCGAFPKREDLERPLTVGGLRPVQFLGQTKLPYDPGPDGFEVFPDVSGWRETLLALRHLAGSVQRKKPEGRKRKVGRPSKEETSKDTLAIAAFAIHHQYEAGGAVGNYDPANLGKLAEQHEGLTRSTLSRFLKKKFGERGHKGYVAACTAEKIGSFLAKWQGDTPSGMHGLNEEEYGRNRY